MWLVLGYYDSAQLRAEYSSENSHGSMHVRFDRPDRLIQYLRNFGMTAAFDETERCGGAQMHRQLQQRLLHEFYVRSTFDDLLGLLGPFLRLV
jgi:hypothetical protein